MRLDVGRFVSRDIWGGDSKIPMSYNTWLFGYANPVLYRDPTGYYGDCDYVNDPGEQAACDREFYDYINYGNKEPLSGEYFGRDDFVSNDKYYTGSEKVPPPHTQFYPTNDPLASGAQGLLRKNAAQLELFNGKQYLALCGQISLLAILNIHNNNIDINKIIDYYKLAVDKKKITNCDKINGELDCSLPTSIEEGTEWYQLNNLLSILSVAPHFVVDNFIIEGNDKIAGFDSIIRRKSPLNEGFTGNPFNSDLRAWKIITPQNSLLRLAISVQ